jgi:DNA-binding transcriptional LysR family regulator
LDTRQLRCYVALARRLSVRLAAADLFLSSATLGRQVKRLEQDLGLTLFRRSGRFVSLTAAGAGLLDEAVEALERIDRVADRLRDSAPVTGAIRLAHCPESSAAGVPALLTALEPGRSIVSHEQAAPQVASEVTNGTASVGLIVGHTRWPGLHSWDLFRLSPLLLVPADDPLAGMDLVTPEHLRRSTVVLPPRYVVPALHSLVRGLLSDVTEAPAALLEGWALTQVGAPVICYEPWVTSAMPGWTSRSLSAEFSLSQFMVTRETESRDPMWTSLARRIRLEYLKRAAGGALATSGSDDDA